ncbi:MAG: hypothetical protein HY862_11805 [Chloroflexi bacterium]|nr:hypothetical protein [Chloroflexota bacterium]
MLRRLFNQYPYIQEGFTRGLINGGVLIFLILIGLPAGMPGREDLAPLAVPLFVLTTITFSVVTVRRFEGRANWKQLLANGVALGIGTAIPFLLFMSLINRWQANGTDVNNYFYEIKPRTTAELSGVPEEELFANPKVDPLTQEFPPDAPVRTNPMSLKINDDKIHVFDIKILSIGGLYGTALVLGIFSVLAMLIYHALSLVHWAQRWTNLNQYLSRSGSGRGLQSTIPEVLRWVRLILPILLFLFLFASVSMSYDTSFWRDIRGENIKNGPILDVTNFGFGPRAVQNFQLMTGFLVIIALMLALRNTRYKTYRLPYLLQLLIILIPIWLVFLLAMWRIQANGVYFIEPTIHLGIFEGERSASLAAAFLLAGLLTLNALRGSLTPEHFESTFVISTGLAMVMATPLFMDQYQTGVMLQVAIYAMLGLGLNIVVGYAGLLDLGYVAFFAMGAYVYAMVESNRQRLSVDNANNLAFTLATAIVIVPLVIFVLANVWLRAKQSTRAKESTPQALHMARLWQDQPPLLISLLLVVIAVLVAFGSTYLLKEAGVFNDVERASPFFIGLILAVFASAFTGFLLGFPVLRLRSDYLAIVTLGFGEIISISLENLESITGGPFGASNIHKPVAGNPTTAEQNMILLYLALVGAGLIAVFSTRLRSSRLGRTWTAIRSDEDIAQAQGINLVNSKLLAFAIGASFAGMAGLLFAARQNNIFPADFSLNVSINVLALVIIGGVGSIPGVIVGTIVLVGLPQMLRALQDYRYLTFGALLVVMMLVRPAGLMPAPLASLEERARKLRGNVKPQREEIQREEAAGD